MVTIDTGITEADLFEAILASERLPMYDPAKHLSSEVAAREWHVTARAALELLKRKAEEYGLQVVEVRSPKTGKRIMALAR